MNIRNACIYPSEVNFNIDQECYSVQYIAHVSNGNDFEEWIATTLKDIDCYISYQDGELEIKFNYVDSDFIISNLNSVVEKFSISMVTLSFIANEEHKQIIKDRRNRYRFLNQQSYSKKYKDLKYHGALYDDVGECVDILEKCGFGTTGDKVYIKHIYRNGTDIETYCIELFFNNITDIFPLKCKVGNIDVNEIRYYEYRGILPLELY